VVEWFSERDKAMMTNAEVARHDGLSEGYIEQVLNRALKRIQRNGDMETFATVVKLRPHAELAAVQRLEAHARRAERLARAADLEPSEQAEISLIAMQMHAEARRQGTLLAHIPCGSIECRRWIFGRSEVQP